MDSNVTDSNVPDSKVLDSNDSFLSSFRKKKSNESKETDLKDAGLHEVPQRAVAVGPDEDYYDMGHYKRGKAIIFNHYQFDDFTLGKRSGTDLDAKNLASTFGELKFDVKVYDDLKYGHIYDVLKKLSKEDHSDNDCLVVVVMSHGDTGVLHARDHTYPPDILWNHFTGDLCPSLAGKPKLFFIQACRGDELDPGVEVNERVDSGDKDAYVLPIMADILVMYSTSPNHYSFRSPVAGSWFVQALCKEISKRARFQDLLTILTFVNRRMAVHFSSNVPGNAAFHNKKQVGSIVTSLTRLLHFYPDFLKN